MHDSWNLYLILRISLSWITSKPHGLGHSAHSMLFKLKAQHEILEYRVPTGRVSHMSVFDRRHLIFNIIWVVLCLNAT